MINNIVFRPIYLEKNVGHGNARRRSLDECSNSLIALMDADDICMNYRFQRQLEEFIQDSSLSIVGGQIAEFVGSPDKIVGIRKVPETHDEIALFMKKRCPMNQVSVMFRKEDVKKAGGYCDWYCEEDYYLWLRMMEAGSIFRNVPDILVNVRTGEGMASRRGGWKYFLSEAKLQLYMLKKRVITLPRFLYNTAIRFGGEILVSNKVRQKLFHFMRQKPNSISENKKSTNILCINNETIYPAFSVSMCVYDGDNAKWFDTALNSVINQTIKPKEIVLVVDGPVSSEIKTVIEKYKMMCK